MNWRDELREVISNLPFALGLTLVILLVVWGLKSL